VDTLAQWMRQRLVGGSLVTAEAAAAAGS